MLLLFNAKWILASFVSLMLASCSSAEFKCLKCEKTVDCLKNVTAISSVICSENITTCYTQIFEDGSVSRDCMAADFKCTGENCKSCNAENCNNNNICKTCDSTNDPKCAQTDAADVKNAICTNTNNKCMMSVLEGKTQRGCVTDDIEKNCTNEKNCKMCEGGICNVGIFPTDRLNCHQCTESSVTCPNAQNNSSDNNNKNDALPCLLYVENDKCYMYGIDSKHVIRGCTSDIGTTNKCTKDGNDVKCKTCNTNNCNEWSYEMDQSLMCINCSSKNYTQCAWGQSASNAIKCEKKIFYTAEERCYTRTDENTTVTRGCFYDLNETEQAACAEAKNCTVCSNSNGCNNVNANNFECIRCRSDNDRNCLNNVKGMGGGPCRNLVTSEADAKCFAGVWSSAVVIRGCLVDLEARDQVFCNQSNNKCYVCSGTNCNTKNPNAATHLLLSKGLLAFVGFALWRLK